MILAAAQTSPKQYDIQANLNDHYKFIRIAHQKGARLITFPEMSITGYEREKAKELSFTVNDSRLDKLSHLSVQYKMIVIAGAPVQIGDDLFIGSFIFHPTKGTLVYTKQFLHTGEELFFSSSTSYNPQIIFRDEKVSLAICADINHPQHPENASSVKSTLYIPGIFSSSGGMPDTYRKLTHYAQSYSLNVLMSNFCGQSWGMDSGGKSAFWNNKGELIASLDGKNPGLLLAEKKNGVWTATSYSFLSVR